MKRLLNSLVLTLGIYVYSFAQNDYSFSKLGWQEDSLLIEVVHLRTQNPGEDKQLQNPETHIRDYLSTYIRIEGGFLIANFPSDYQPYAVANFESMTNSSAGKTMITVEKQYSKDGYITTERKPFRTYDLLGKGDVVLCPTNKRLFVSMNL